MTASDLPSPPPHGADVLIVGAGVMGYGLAWRLSASGRRVVILDRGNPGGEASGAAAGILAAQLEARENAALLALALASRLLYPGWAAALHGQTGLDIGLRRCGVLMLAAMDPAVREADLRDQGALLEQQRALNLPVESLTPAEVRGLEPGLAEVAGALRFSEDGQVEPPRLLTALSAAAGAQGVQFVRGEVQNIELATQSGRDHAVTFVAGGQSHTLWAPQLVLCAGSWSASIVGTPLSPPSIFPVRGQMVELFASPSPLQHVCFGHVPSRLPATTDLRGAQRSQPADAGHGYLVPRGDGRIVIGSTTERVGFVKTVTTAGLLDLLTLAESLVPALGGASVTQTWAGLRPGSADELPLIGPVHRPGVDPAHPSVWVLSGHYRNGILLAPASVEALCAQLCGTPLPPELVGVPLTAFAADRYAASAAVTPST
jgi:glycine oxidase